MATKKKLEPMFRINSRIRKDQQKFIKDYAKKHKTSEGGVLRFIIDFFMKA